MFFFLLSFFSFSYIIEGKESGETAESNLANRGGKKESRKWHQSMIGQHEYKVLNTEMKNKARE